VKFVRFCVISIVLISGCSQALLLELHPTEELRLSDHTKKYSAITSCNITPESRQYKALEKWLTQNQEGWQSTPASYISGIVVSGSGFTLNFLGSAVIANYLGGQYSHAITPFDYESLKCDLF